MTLPNFFIIGAQKGGTSALDAYLNQHPEIFIPEQKELNYYALKGQAPQWTGEGDDIAIRLAAYEKDHYLSFFRKARNSKAVGESSVLYLYDETVAENIADQLPRAKIIAVLRNPADRGYSAFLHLRRDGREKSSSFEDGLAREEERIQLNYESLWHYRQVGLYSDQLARYFHFFPRENIKIILFEDLQENPLKVSQEIFSFLDVAPDFTPDVNFKLNVSGTPTNQSVNDFFNKPNIIKDLAKRVFPLKTGRKLKYLILKRFMKKSDKISVQLRNQLLEFYREDILKTEKIIGRELSHWLNTEKR